MHYSGIGSRQTPENILKRMENLAVELAKKGYILRSGGAEGADSAFERGCDKAEGEKEIFLPWKKFNNNSSPLYTPHKEAFEIIKELHPIYNQLSQGVKKLHARNVHQILGKDLTSPSKFVIYWSKGKGGTIMAIKVAEIYNVPVFNLSEREK